MRYFYDKEMSPLSLQEWGDLYCDESYRFIRDQAYFDCIILLEWDGLGSYLFRGKSLIYQLTVFCASEREKVKFENVERFSFEIWQ